MRTLRDSLSVSEVTRLVESGQLDAILTATDIKAALAPYRQSLITVTERAYDATKLPQPAPMFDVLSPTTLDAVRELDSRVVNTLSDEVRETVRAHIENGLRDGRPPRTVARSLREVIGLAPNQERAVENFERTLRGETDRSATDYALRDKRFDRLLAKGPLSEPQIDRMTAAYRRKMLAFNAETNARTATLDSMKLGQRLSWDEAVEKGIVTGPVNKTWVGVMDDRERPEHVAMEGETVPKDAIFSNGEDIPGESTFNCRCLARYTIAEAA